MNLKKVIFLFIVFLLTFASAGFCGDDTAKISPN